MDKSTANVRPEILALGTLIETTIERISVNESKQHGEGMLFLNRQTAFPARVVQDSVLEPVDKLVWMTILLQARASSTHRAFPSYDCIQKTANIASRSTVARSIAVLRATRWLTLWARVRECSGRFGGSVYALHDEPLALVDVLHLDSGYMAFLDTAQQHAHARVRLVAKGVLEALDEDIRNGIDVWAGHHPVPQGKAVVKITSSDGPSCNPHVRKQPSAASSTYVDVGENPGISQPTKPPTQSNDLILGEGEVPLVYPKRLDKNQWALTNRYLASVLPEQRQPILDELDGRLCSVEKGMRPLYDEMSFLNSLCTAMRNGEFKLKLGASVQAERTAREKVRAKRRQSSPALNPDPRALRAQLEAGTGAFTRIRQSLGHPRRTGSHRPDKD
ncbi:MAG: helix-turn-helix domain-containing protein [Gammaproteobacteria bacterium]|nr:helix-turn-helix domain-containing protein [Gammaproteobacteria bacterium]